MLLVPLFADNVATASFTLCFLGGAVRSENTEVRFTEDDLTGESKFPQQNKATGTSEMNFAIDANTTADTVQGYITYQTNTTKDLTLYVLPSKLTTTDSKNTYAINYTLVMDNQSYNTAVGGSMIALTVESTGSSRTIAMKSFPVAIVSDATSFSVAPEGDYTGTIVVYLQQP